MAGPVTPPIPYGVLVGPGAGGIRPGVGPWSAARGRAVSGGATWYRLDGGPATPYAALVDVLRAHGPADRGV